MKKLLFKAGFLIFILPHVIFPSCRERNTIPSKNAINELDLKRGAVISCGQPGKQFGRVEFAFSGNENIKKDFKRSG